MRRVVSVFLSVFFSCAAAAGARMDTLVFQAALSPSNEVPPVPGLAATGAATITIFVNRNEAGAPTSATVDFDVSFSGFPASTNFVGLHIHNGPAGIAAPVVIGTDLSGSRRVIGLPSFSGGASPAPRERFSAQVARNPASGAEAGVAVVNVSNQDLRIIFRFTSVDGRLVQGPPVLLRSGEQISRLLGELIPELLVGEDRLEIRASDPLPLRSLCFLCQTPLEIKTSKKDKPYLACEDCGVQVFFRLRKGIERLKLLLEGRVSFADNFVLCRQCRVAVEKCPGNVEEPFFGKSGIRCPRCEKFLVEVTKAEVQRK